MRRAASWTKGIVRTPEGGACIKLHVPLRGWLRRRDVIVEVRVDRDEAAVMQAQLTRILDGGQSSSQFPDGQGLHPNYRGAVN